MGWIMEGLDAEAYDRSYDDRNLLRRVMGYFRPQLGVMALVAVAIVVSSVTNTGVTVLIAEGIDLIGEEITWGVTGVLILAIILSGVVAWFTNYLNRYYTAKAVSQVVLRLRLDAFDAVLKRDLSFYDEFASGKIVSRVTSDTESFSTVVTLTLNLMSQFLLFILLVAVMFYIDWRLALLALIIAPFIFAISLGFRAIARRVTRQAQRSAGLVNANVQEAISGISVAKTFRQEGRIYGEFQDVNAKSYGAMLRQGYIFNGIFPLLITVASLGTVIVLYFGGTGVLDGSISPGDWFLFVQSVSFFWFPLTSIASFWSQFQLGLSASERVFALIDAEPRVVQTGNEPVDRLAGKIEFRHLDFGYNPSHLVLKDFNLTIQPGETVALVGHTGAGKSTIGRLIPRFYEFQHGELLIDGRDIRSFDLASYRRQLGIVPQVPFLFSGTVAENIRYGRPGATDAEVEVVALRVGSGDWLEALPEGLATSTGESGRGLSMGQRQLVALARVLLQDPAIVILDEATASVDPLTEAQIQEGLDVVLRGRTSIAIAHRLSTIIHADRIIVLDHGRIVEEGSHEALLLRGGPYANLYNTYFRHQSPDYQPGEGFVPVQAAD